ncbi:FabD/lysophospholipase-like protein [Aspergillus ambiguus]|uniref:patatin-like phospholipase family protein n=1 Tax=Aspergillus ambiguus TaxID=176160 RepID=UPI003CCDB8BC
MSEKSNADWLYLVRHAAGTFVHHGRCLSHIKEQLITPHMQFPTSTLFFGKRRKDIALRYLFPDNHISSRFPSVQIRIDNRTLFSDFPILFADDHDREEVAIDWPAGDDLHLRDVLLARLLFMFMDVVCIFADDIGGLDAVLAALETWAAAGRNVTNLDHRPRILIVVETDNASITHELLEESEFLHQFVHTSGTTDVFGAISFLRLPSRELSNMARHQPLKDELLKGLDLSRRRRREDGCLFSAAHLEGFFRCALQHVCHTPQQPFDFVRSARRSLPSASDHGVHLKRFLDLTAHSEWEQRAAFIASTLLVDAYSPGGHYFSPAVIFDCLYRNSCQGALVAAEESPARCQMIEYHLSRYYHELLLGRGPPRRVHQANLEGWYSLVGHAFSSQTCLGCLTQPPQHPLTCGHAYCDTCAARYGIPVEGAEYRYQIVHCVLCGRNCNNLVSLLPRTAPLRALTIDGGGVRVFIPLRFLEYMQRILGPETAVQDLFDIAFGTSTGGLSVLKLCHQRHSVVECRDAFADSMLRFFHSQPSATSAWGKFLRTIRCWWTDGWYDARTWDRFLQEQFGSKRRMFDVQPVSGTKIAVVTTVNDPVLLTNYRRTNSNDKGKSGLNRAARKVTGGLTSSLAYSRTHEPRSADEEPTLWECARATTAAPGLFPPIDIPGVGSCEDGGLKYNCPASICVREARFMWPREEPAALISLGTGSSTSEGPKTCSRRRAHRERTRGFAFRLFDTFMASMDAEKAWKELLPQVLPSKRQNYHRLNVTFPGTVPLLNAVGSVKWMTGLVDQVAEIKVPPALSSLLLASLFLELHSLPLWQDGYYHCVGAIRCRLRGHTLVDVLRRLHPHASTYVFGAEELEASPFDGAVCNDCSRYCVPIRFALKGPDSSIHLSLKIDADHLRLLGGFPAPLRWFLERQGLPLFGHHVAPLPPGRSECKSCDMRIHRKSALVRSHRSYRKRVRFI